MTDDLITSSKKQHDVYSSTSTQRSINIRNRKRIERGIRDLILAIDFNKWNITMRYLICMYIFQASDKLFGFNKVFDNTHKLCYVYATYSGSTHIIDFAGKFVNSVKGWTIVTEALIEASARRRK